MKLHEFHVGNTAAGPPAHGDAVAGGSVRIGGVQIDLARAAGGQHGILRRHGQHMVALFVQDVCAITAVFRLADFSPGNQIHRNVLFKDGDVGVREDQIRQRLLHRFAGRIGGMDDAAATVTAFAREVKIGAAAFASGKRHPLFNQPADGGGAALDHETCGLLVA